MKFTLYIVGLRPAHSQAANEFLSNLDLGISGAYVKDYDILTVTLKPGLGRSHIDAVTIPAVMAVYQAQGWKDVKVYAK